MGLLMICAFPVPEEVPHQKSFDAEFARGSQTAVEAVPDTEQIQSSLSKESQSNAAHGLDEDAEVPATFPFGFPAYT
jgi:hypothetical protein